MAEVAQTDRMAGGALRRRLARSRRRRRMRASLLVLPLAAFLIAFFIVPLASILWTSVRSDEVSRVLPRVSEALSDWDREGLPDEEVFAALAADLAESYEAKTVAEAATRLNHEVGGFRSMIMRTARSADEMEAPFRDAIMERDEHWAEMPYWQALAAASQPFTPRYLAASLDLQVGWDGEVSRAPLNERIYVELIQRTFWMSGVVTVLCILIGYPLAYMTATAPPGRARLLLVLILLPFWTSLLVRTAAWVVLLQKEGMINGLLLALGIVDAPLQLIFNRIGVYVAMTHILLPFMVLPLYSVMRGIPANQLRAAASLGASPLAGFLTVYLPQTVPGLGAGCLLVFVLSLGFYITPALVGGSTDQMVSYVIAQFALGTANWGMAAALAVVLLVCVAIVFPIYQRFIGIDRLKLG